MIMLNAFRRTCAVLHSARFHRNLPQLNKQRVKRLRNKKYEEDFQNQKRIVDDFIRGGTLTGIERLKESVFSEGKSLTDVTFNAHFIDICSQANAFELGRDFFKQLYSEGRAGIAASGKFFVLCAAHKEKCGPEELNLMVKVYDELLDKYGVLDAKTCEELARGLGLTDRWSDELARLLKMVTDHGESPTPTLWCTVIAAALHHGDKKAAWSYMDSYAASGKHILPQLYESVLKEPTMFLPLLRWLKKHGIIIFGSSAEIIVRLAPSIGGSAHLTTVAQSGVCHRCRTRLHPTPLSTDDFNKLRAAFLDPVLIGKDVFQKTRPEELKSYLKFLDKILPVDVVLDGLNVAYTNASTQRGSRVLRHVTAHFALHKILVVGRQHMSRWPAADMNFIRDRAHLFLAEDVSQDDPFLLYATLKSGKATKFVSRDRMGAHKFLLGQPDLRRIFSKWQALSQYHPLRISPDGSSVVLKPPSDFAREAQETARGCWHLPVVDHSLANIQGYLQDEKAPWLCVKIQDC